MAFAAERERNHDTASGNSGYPDGLGAETSLLFLDFYTAISQLDGGAPFA